MIEAGLEPDGARAPLLVATLILIGSTGLAMLANPAFGEGYSSLIFVAGITMIGAYSGVVISTTCALVGALSFNYFIAAPVYEFSFRSPHELLPPLIFVICSVTSGLIAGRARDRAEAARALAMQIDRLLAASRAYQSATDRPAIRDLLADAVRAAGDHCALFWLGDGAIDCIAGGGGVADVPAVARAVIGASEGAAGQPAILAEPVGDGAAPSGALLVASVRDKSGQQWRETSNYLFGLVRLANLALERIRLAEQLAEQQAEARLDALQAALLMSVSHDLRTPLTAIGTAATSLRLYGAAMDGTTRSALLESIDDECERMNRLTGNLLQMTRIEAGALRPGGMPQGAADMVRATLRRFARAAATRQIVCADLDETLVVAADTALFEQALGNIIDNAIKYSASDSTITVTCRAEGTMCAITVVDQGCGIAEAEQAAVFRRFYRGTGVGGRPTAGGSGLGLAIARGFVEASGGAIALQSPVADGRGTTVTIRLPLVEDQKRA